MTCPDCTKAATELWHGFRAYCDGCSARGVGRGPNFRRVRDAGRLDWKYRHELELVGVTHDQVKAAHAVDFAERARP